VYLIESSSTVDSNYWLWVYLIESSSTVDSNYWLWMYLIESSSTVDSNYWLWVYLIESSSTVDSNYWLWVYLIESSSTVDSNYWLWVYLMKVHPRLIVVHVTRSLVLCVCFVDRCLSFCTVSFGHCVVFFFFYIQIMIIPLVSSNSFQWGSCFLIFSFMCMFCRSLFVLLSFFYWP
jgi:hypothetical protein